MIKKPTKNEKNSIKNSGQNKVFQVFFNNYQIVKNNQFVFVNIKGKKLKTKTLYVANKNYKNIKSNTNKKTNKNTPQNFCYYTSKKTKKRNFLTIILTGITIGFINGFWGGGGGMVCVPALTNIFKLPEKKAHATAILIMLPLSISSLIVYFLGGKISWENTAFIATGFTLGGVLGALLLKKINNLLLKLIFSLVIIAGAIRMLF